MTNRSNGDASQKTRPILSLKNSQAGNSAPEKAPEAQKLPEREEPKAYRLTSAFGFVNEYDAVYHKPEGAIITNPVEIAVLMKRKAPLVEESI